MIMNDGIVNLLKNALAEDLGTGGDVTSQAIFDANDIGEALIRCKQSGVLSGIALIAPLFELVDAAVPQIASAGAVEIATKTEIYCSDGDTLEAGKVVCRIKGAVWSILAGERTALNLLRHLSGIATETAKMTCALGEGGGQTRLLDTRKTTPGLRALEKAAVRHGGGENHRFGLYDMILIKDTHIKRAGGVKHALAKALAWRGNKSAPQIEIEVQSTEEFIEALELKPDMIMLDNMSPKEIELCIDERDTSGLNIKLEASGNITLGVLPAIAATNVDFVSAGAITHSAPSLDFHLVMT